MDLKKAHDRKGLWDVPRIYGVGGHSLKGILSFCKDVNAFVHMKSEVSKSFGVGAGVRRVCGVTMAF